MNKKSHHYVPQFYLRNFSGDNSIGKYVIQHRRYVAQASIRQEACKDYMYGEDGVLENALAALEQRSARVLRNIIQSESLNLDEPDRLVLMLFAILSEARSLRTADASDHFTDFQMKTLLKMDKNNNLTEKDLEGVEIAVAVPNATSIKVAVECLPILLDLAPVLIVNRTDKHFITSDNPLVKYNQLYVVRKYTLRGYGLGSQGLQLFLPISPKLCVCLFDKSVYEAPERDGRIVFDRIRQVDELNRLTYLNSYRCLYFNRVVSHAYVERVTSRGHNLANLDDEISVFGNDDEKFIGFHPSKVTELINLRCFQIRPEYLAMPLPAHMGGLVRPKAYEFVKRLNRETLRKRY